MCVKVTRGSTTKAVSNPFPVMTSTGFICQLFLVTLQAGIYVYIVTTPFTVDLVIAVKAIKVISVKLMTLLLFSIPLCMYVCVCVCMCNQEVQKYNEAF